jgi:hypothetical protein
VTALGLPIGTVGISDPAQLLDGLTQLGRIHPPRHLHQHRVGFELHLVGQLAGAVGDHPGMGR